MTVPSSEAEAIDCPSGDHATAVTTSKCPSSHRRHTPSSTSQSEMVWSLEPAASIRPLGDQATLLTCLLCFPNVRDAPPASGSQSWMVPSHDDEARLRPSGDQAILPIEPVWPRSVWRSLRPGRWVSSVGFRGMGELRKEPDRGRLCQSPRSAYQDMRRIVECPGAIPQFPIARWSQGRLVRPGGCRTIDRPGGPIRVSRSRLEFKVSWLARTPGICETGPGGGRGFHQGPVRGKLVFHVFGALAEVERDIIRERTLAGLAAARARGRMGGPATLTTRRSGTP